MMRAGSLGITARKKTWSDKAAPAMP
jgi:hypothetical protein